VVSESDGTDVFYSTSFFGQKADQQFGELVYNSPNLGSFRFLVGANILHEIATQGITVTTPPLNRVTQIDARIPTFSYAVFGRATYDILDNWRVFGGLRYSHDDKKIVEANNFLGTNRQEAQWGDLTYEIGSSVDISSRVSAYLKYATGFKAGGFSGGSAAPAFGPEKNSSIEAGIKGSLPGNGGRFSLIAFHTPYTDMQVSQIRGFSTFIENAAEAEINGVEFEGSLNILPALRWDLVASALDAKFKRFTSIDSARPTLGTLDLSGNYLPKAPKFSGSTALTYTYELPDGGTISPSVRYNWQSRVYYSEFNVPVSSQKAVGRVDLHLDFESANKRWSGSLFVNNLTDEAVINNVIIVSATLGSAALGNLDPGRRIGASITRRF
jgi:iron complex outermembrane receptor protein